MKKESNIQNAISLALSESGVPVFRNNVGAVKVEGGRFIRYGVGGAGGSDLIDVAPTVVTQEMVGKTIGVFIAVEVKSNTGRATKQQEKFIQVIKGLGGIAGVAKSGEAAKDIIESWKNGIEKQE